MELLSPKLGLIFWTFIVFIILLWILKRFAWKPILETLDERENRIRAALEDAERSRQEAQETLNKYQQLLDEAKKEAQEILAKSRKTAEATRDEIVQKAQAEANHLIERARKEIDLEREKAIDELRREAVELSLMIASRLIGKSLSPDDHSRLIAESLEQLGETN
jgi:F-type H+-transporting ATPase subunit b